jgi:hypothetical protein
MGSTSANRRWRWPFRCRGSRHDSAVAQLSTLGHIMRITHFKRLALIIVLQVVMELVCLFYFSSSPHRWIPFAVAGLLLPFIGYIAALDSAPLLTKWPLILKASVLTLSSLTLTIGGYIISAILYLWWMMDICQTSP